MIYMADHVNSHSVLTSVLGLSLQHALSAAQLSQTLVACIRQRQEEGYIVLSTHKTLFLTSPSHGRGEGLRQGAPGFSRIGNNAAAITHSSSSWSTNYRGGLSVLIQLQV